MYFRDWSVVKSHKLAEVIREQCLTVDFMEDLKDPDSDIPQGKFPCFLKWADGLLNSGPLGRQLGRSGVYDNSAVALNRNRIPGSMVRDKNSARKGTGWKGAAQIKIAREKERARLERPNGSKLF